MACAGMQIRQKARKQLRETLCTDSTVLRLTGWIVYIAAILLSSWSQQHGWEVWAQHAWACPLPHSVGRPQKNPVRKVRAAETSFPTPVSSPYALPGVLLQHMWIAHQNVTESEFISIRCSWDNISNPSLSYLLYWCCISLYWTYHHLLTKVWKSSSLVK